jgi:hypothetical protein
MLSRVYTAATPSWVRGRGPGVRAQQGRVRPNRVTGTIMKFQLLLPDPSAAAAAACQTEYWPLSVS